MAIKRKLFLSFTSTLGLIARGEVTEEDLMSGLFYFGCMREHALEPWSAHHGCNELEWVFRKEDGGYDADRAGMGHCMLVRAIAAAEADGRAAWRAQGEHQQYDVLDAMLQRHGYGSLLDCLDRYERTDYMSPRRVWEIAPHLGLEVPGRIG